MLQRFIRRVRRLAARPWCALILRCGASLSCGALMAGASALGLPVPVALAWLCAMDFGAEAVCAYAGAAAGYLLLWELADVLEPLAAGFLILSGLGLFRGLLPEERWFRALAGSALYAVVSLIFLLQGPMQPFEIIFFFLRLMVLAGAAFAFSGTQRGKTRLLALIAGSTRLLLPGGLPLRRPGPGGLGGAGGVPRGGRGPHLPPGPAGPISVVLF